MTVLLYRGIYGGGRGSVCFFKKKPKMVLRAATTILMFSTLPEDALILCIMSVPFWFGTGEQ